MAVRVEKYVPRPRGGVVVIGEEGCGFYGACLGCGVDERVSECVFWSNLDQIRIETG